MMPVKVGGRLDSLNTTDLNKPVCSVISYTLNQNLQPNQLVWTVQRPQGVI